MLKTVSLFFILLLTIPHCFSQSGFSFNNNSLSEVNGFNIAQNSEAGTPFVYDEWHQGRIIFDNNTVSEPAYVNYNAESDKIFYKQNSVSTSLYTIDNISKIIGFELSISPSKKDTFIKMSASKFSQSDKVATMNFYKTFDTKENLLIEENIKALTGVDNSGWSASSTSTKGQKYYAKNNLYFLLKDGKYSKISLSKSSFLKALKSDKSSVQKFIKEKNIKCKTTNDALKVIRYYYTL